MVTMAPPREREIPSALYLDGVWHTSQDDYYYDMDGTECFLTFCGRRIRASTAIGCDKAEDVAPPDRLCACAIGVIAPWP